MDNDPKEDTGGPGPGCTRPHRPYVPDWCLGSLPDDILSSDRDVAQPLHMGTWRCGPAFPCGDIPMAVALSFQHRVMPGRAAIYLHVLPNSRSSAFLTFTTSYLALTPHSGEAQIHTSFSSMSSVKGTCCLIFF